VPADTSPSRRDFCKRARRVVGFAALRGAAPAAALLLAACPKSEEEATLVLQDGYGFAWDSLSHRISYLRAGVSEPATGGDGGNGDAAFSAELGLIGGPFSTGEILPDAPAYRLAWRRVRSGALAVAYGESSLSVGPPGLAQATVTLDAAASDAPAGLPGIASSEQIAVVLRGLTLDTSVPQVPGFPAAYDPADGWTPKGMGAGVSAARRASSGTIEFDVWVRFEPGPLDRPDMNAAVPFAVVGATLEWTLVGWEDGSLLPLRADGRAFYVSDPPYSEIPEIDAALRTVAVQAGEGRSLALPLLRSWDLRLNRTLGEEGRYLRAWDAGIADFGYSADDGLASLLFDAYASHSSAFEEGDLELEFSAEAAILLLDDEEAVVETGVVEGLAPEVGIFDQAVGD
jgi:hypothetical protein